MQAPKITQNDRMVPSTAAWRCLQRAHTIRTLSGEGVTGVHNAFFVPGDLDLWPWHSNSSERGTKHVFLWICRNPFSCSGDIWFTNKQTKKQKNLHRRR